jgi:hypothetical protein
MNALDQIFGWLMIAFGVAQSVTNFRIQSASHLTLSMSGTAAAMIVGGFLNVSRARHSDGDCGGAIYQSTTWVCTRCFSSWVPWFFQASDNPPRSQWLFPRLSANSTLVVGSQVPEMRLDTIEVHHVDLVDDDGFWATLRAITFMSVINDNKGKMFGLYKVRWNPRQ